MADEEVLTMDAESNTHRVVKDNLADADHEGYTDYEILATDHSGDEDEKHVRVRWLTPEDADDKPLSEDEVVLPEGVAYENVEFSDDNPESEAWAVTGTNQWGEANQRAFNPQNGRWYSADPLPDKHMTKMVGGLEVECAYGDCSGRTTVEVSGDFSGQRCPECGEGSMGREQFSERSRRQRHRRSGIADVTRELRDDFAAEMDRLTDAGVGPVAAMDYLMCSVGETPAAEWAEARDVRQRSVKRNIKRVADALGETVSYTTGVGWDP